MTYVISKKRQNFRRVMCKFLLCKFRQCEDYSEQSKPYFEPLTFPFQDVYSNVSILTLSTFSLTIFALFAFVLIIINSRKSNLLTAGAVLG